MCDIHRNQYMLTNGIFLNLDATKEKPELDAATIVSEFDIKYNSVIVSNVCFSVVFNNPVWPI